MPPPSASATGSWRPATPTDAGEILNAVQAPWWIAGGWAIDLFLGCETRTHQDLDVGVRRVDAVPVMETLRSWEFFEAHQGMLHRIARGEQPRPEVNSLWGRPVNEREWVLELMLDESGTDERGNEEWVFRRGPSIRRPFAGAIRRTRDGTPYLAPEIQLLYKARDLRARDQADFERACALLGGSAARWLRACLERLYPRHPWLTAL